MSNWSESVIMFISCCKYILFPAYILGFKITNRKTKYILFPIFVAAIIYCGMKENYMPVFDALIMFITLMLLCDVHIGSAIKGFINEIMAISFVDLLMWLFVVGMTPLGAVYFRYETGIEIFTNAIGILPWIVLALIFRKKQIHIYSVIRNMKVRYILLLVLCMGTLAFVITYMQILFLGEMTLKIQRATMVASVIFSIIIIVSCGVFAYLFNSRKRLIEINALNEECIKYQRDYYENILKSNEELRAFRHDVNKHYNSIKILLEDNRVNEAKEYMHKIASENNVEYIYKTENAIADYIINGKIRKINSCMPVKTRVVGKFPRHMSLDNTDLCIVLANALDNAEEALSKIEGNKKLEIYIQNYNERVFITMKNTSNYVDVKNIVTSKTDKINHGYGLSNIERVVERNDGKINMAYENGMFSIEIFV